jgi:hypothetical protein
MGASKGIGRQDVGPDGFFGFRWVGNDPEAFSGVVDDGDDFTFSGSEVPRAAQEIDCMIGIKSALKMERQVQVQQGGGRLRV